MKRVISQIIVVAGLLLLAPPQAHAANPECRFGLGIHAMRQTVWCVANKNGVGVSHALYVANRESGFYHNARNPSSGTCGIYQHMPRYWPSRYAQFSAPRWGRMPNSCYNGRTNIIVSLGMVRAGGWGPWGG